MRLVSFCIYLPTDPSLLFTLEEGGLFIRLVLTNSEPSRQVMVPAAADSVTKNAAIFHNSITQRCIYKPSEGCVYKTFDFFFFPDFSHKNSTRDPLADLASQPEPPTCNLRILYLVLTPMKHKIQENSKLF